MQPILSKDTHYFPFHQMFGGFSRHFFSACKYFKERRGESRATSWLDCYAEPRMLLQRKLKSDWSPPAPRWGVSLRRREAQCGAVLHEVRPYSGGGLRNISISIFLPLSNKRLPF